MPLSDKLLKPEIQTNVTTKIAEAKAQQASYYSRISQSLPVIQPGELVRVKLPKDSIWTQAICKRKVAPRSYEVECNGRTYRRNRRDLRPTPEQLISTSDTPIPVDVPQVPVNVAPYPEIKVEDSDLAPSHTPESQSASVRTLEPQEDG